MSTLDHPRFVAVVLSCLSAPLAGQSACRLDWALDETLRIGSLDGEDALEYVMDRAIDPVSEEIFVPQTQRGEVLVFSTRGEPRRRIGREGSGPGDFEAGPRAVAWVEEVWATSTDDLEVPYIHRYRVDRGCSPDV